MKVIAIVQTRMGSTRLPGKVLKDLEGKSVMARVIERLRRCKLLNDVVIATTDGSSDDVIVQECRRLAVSVSRGDEQNVLDRYYRAAQLFKADVVVRVTSDCPLIDPEITDKTIAAFLEVRPDYASNVRERTYPRGLDTEVFTFDALARTWRVASKPYERVHVTPYIYEHPQEFRILSVTGDKDYSSHRWTIDTPEDLEFIRAVYARLKDKPTFLWTDVLQVLDREPKLIEINSGIEQKAVHEG